MKTNIPNGIWPTMITPFSECNKVDFAALRSIIEWYIAHGVNGLFAVCQSSEMFHLSLDEKIQLARFIKNQSDNRVPVIASGPTSTSILDLVREVEGLADTGVEAVVLLTNSFAKQDEDDYIWIKNVEKLLSLIPDHINLGLYECPFPYKRLLSPELLLWLSSTNRFSFLKDTSCSLQDMEKKLHAVAHTNLKIYNANSATFLESLKLGISGYSGVMANFHPELYVWLHCNWESNPKKSKTLSNLLGVTSLIERQLYPTNAKYHMRLLGLPLTLKSRVYQEVDFNASMKIEVEQLMSLVNELKRELNL